MHSSRNGVAKAHHSLCICIECHRHGRRWGSEQECKQNQIGMLSLIIFKIESLFYKVNVATAPILMLMTMKQNQTCFTTRSHFQFTNVYVNWIRIENKVSDDASVNKGRWESTALCGVELDLQGVKQGGAVTKAIFYFIRMTNVAGEVGSRCLCCCTFVMHCILSVLIYHAFLHERECERFIKKKLGALSKTNQHRLL